MLGGAHACIRVAFPYGESAVSKSHLLSFDSDSDTDPDPDLILRERGGSNLHAGLPASPTWEYGAGGDPARDAGRLLRGAFAWRYP
jgi:hypothetical protein